MSKEEADNYKKIAIWDITKGLSGNKDYKSSGFSFDNGFELDYQVNLYEELPRIRPFVQLDYSWEGRRYNTKLSLSKTPCNYGGYRQWFICGCGERVGILYLVGGNWGCIKCYDLTYATRKLNKGDRLDPLYQVYKSKLADRIAMKTKLYFYNGKPTKNAMRINKLTGGYA